MGDSLCLGIMLHFCMNKILLTKPVNKLSSEYPQVDVALTDSVL
jgi:hypothetical protein